MSTRRQRDGSRRAPYDLRQGLGCTLFLGGVIMTLAGVLTLSDIFPFELEFFEIEVDSRPRQIVWTTGFAATALIGYRLFRARKRAE